MKDVKITYDTRIEVDIGEMAYTMGHSEAHAAIIVIDQVICDLDFTLKLAKHFIEMVKAEGVDDYTNELKELLK